MVVEHSLELVILKNSNCVVLQTDHFHSDYEEFRGLLGFLLLKNIKNTNYYTYSQT